MSHNHVIGWMLLVLLAAAALVAFVASSAGGTEEREIATINFWHGSVADESFRDQGVDFLTNQRALEELWLAWGIEEPLPLIDFNTEIALVITGNGSILRFSGVTVSDHGDLVFGRTESLDLVPGFRYALGTVKRAGIRTINGKDMPRHEILDTSVSIGR